MSADRFEVRYEKTGEFLRDFQELLTAKLPAGPSDGEELTYKERARRSLQNNGKLVARSVLDQAIRSVFKEIGVNDRDVFIADKYTYDHKQKTKKHEGAMLAMRSPFPDDNNKIISFQDYLKREGYL